MTYTREDWVRDLRSGEFKQATRKLESADGLCCLGVAAKRMSAPGVTRDELPDGSVRYLVNGDEANAYETTLPPPMVAALGLRTPVGVFDLEGLSAEVVAALRSEVPLHLVTFRPDGTTVSLTRLNDDGVSFATIAKIIEENPKGLFQDES